MMCHIYNVMAGLVPAIHVFLADCTKKDVDARDKPGHDDLCYNFEIPGSRAQARAPE
ncbi:MAG TPA: hypothetical protein VK804_10640 [Bradyrhizobium sp.]|uniref:hypothetical protein n=1 Tax=Bradyrhizobium sp. TaxID=376 RepID=UPI002B7A4C72|nr:hypothetical protein [Bradyrhizobium sp.]HTB00922.1 hypothetical protein [Bradyrhizobium sp.]